GEQGGARGDRLPPPAGERVARGGEAALDGRPRRGLGGGARRAGGGVDERHGASGRKSPGPARGRQGLAGAPARAHDARMPLDVLESEFDELVVERSRTVPVLVDVWAPWCGPCRVLGPVLERLEAEAGGAWELVKIDADGAPELS